MTLSRFLLLVFLLGTAFQLEAQCPGCVITLPPGMTADTVYLSPAPDGEVGVPYDEDISFRLPQSTTPVAVVDPTVPPGLPISEIIITSVTNLPPGLSWEASKLNYSVGSGDTDGCVKFCGTPTLSDSFFVQVMVTANVFGIVQSASFSVPVYIAPAATTNLGFSMVNNIGCGSTTVSFTNNIPSNGVNGFSYSWNFGNGNTSIMENPGPQLYSEPGVYPVTYTATIDTVGYFLTAVTIVETDCKDDINIPAGANKPDLFIKVKNSGGTTLYTSPIANNANVPYTFFLNLQLGAGNYSVEVTDDDLIGVDDCGSVNFTQSTTGNLSDGALVVSLNINHPVTTVNTVDSVYVYPVPDNPIVLDMGLDYCAGESTQLEVTNYSTGLQWYVDSMPIPGAFDPVFEATESGSYWVVYTSEEGCTSSSEKVELSFLPLPGLPVFLNTNNLLSVTNPNGLPADYSLQWYQDGIAIADANGLNYCILTEGTSEYTLEVVNLVTGCANSYSSQETYNPNADCSTGVWDEGVAAQPIRLFPNPVSQQLYISVEDLPQGPVEVVCFNTLGQQLLPQQLMHPGNTFQFQLPVDRLENGWYVLVIRSLESDWVLRKSFVKVN